jgi:FKBP-type peptidyl-prolyl cis-trans isomerase FklB
MQKLFFFILTFLSLSAVHAQNSQKSDNNKMKGNQSTKINTTQNMDTLSYSLGLLLAQNIKDLGFEKLVISDIAQGLDDVIKGNSTKVSINEANTLINNEIAMINERKSASVIEEGKKFLAKRPGVITTASGLQYEIITPGTGATPKATDQVTTNYRGTLIDGTQFDSSYDRNEPTTFPVNGVIKGWTEALQLMKEGAKWELYIPYNLAYGTRGAGKDIPPYATLIFEIELLKVN